MSTKTHSTPLSDEDRLRQELARAQDRYDEVTREFLAFQSVSNDLLSTTHLDETLSSVLRGLEEGLGYAFGGIAVLDERENVLFLQASPDNGILDAVRRKSDLALERLRIPLDPEVNTLAKSLADGRVTVSRDLAGWLGGSTPEVDAAAVAESLSAVGIRLIVSAPMSVGGSPGGLLFGGSQQAGMTSTERESLQNFANQAGMAIENAQLVADLRRMRDEMSRKNEALQQLEQMKEGLVQMVVHDMKNPITSVRGYLELLLDEPEDRLSPDLRKHVRISYDSSGRLLNMVRDLLDISRMEEGKFNVRTEPVDVSRLIESVAVENRAQASRQKKEIEVAVQPSLPYASADPDLIGRVISNLVSNAIKHTPHGSQITIEATTDGPERVRVAVKDTGEGIPVEYRKKIFEKFSVVETRRQGGARMNTGLGLTFCRMAVEAHEGRIWLESEEGKGSTFQFTLPVDESSAPKPQTPEPD